MRKPDGCKTCPLYGDGTGYVADELCEDATVLVVGGEPTKDDVRVGRAFVSDEWDEVKAQAERGGVRRGVDAMAKRCAPNVNVMELRPDVHYAEAFTVWETRDGNTSFMNVRRCRPQRGVSPTAITHAGVCCRQYDVLQPTIQVIVALGENPWRVLADDAGSVVEWRGRVVTRSS